MPPLLARRVAARVGARVARRRRLQVGVVLMYHELADRAGEPRRDPSPELGTGTFAAQLRHLTRHYEIVPLASLRERIAGRRQGQRLPVALTFDDDCASHVERAAPLLMEHGLPATFFLTGRTLDGPSPFWWQDLRALARRGDRAFTEVRRRLERLNARASGGGVLDLAEAIENLVPDDRELVAAELRRLAEPEVTERGLSAAAVGELAAAGFEIGFHTSRHDPLPPLDDVALAGALSDGLGALTAVAGRRPDAIAYPHCRADQRVAQAAVRAGFVSGVRCSGRPVREDTPPLLTDRIDGWAASADALAWKLMRLTT